jgi:hypothetical protein
LARINHQVDVAKQPVFAALKGQVLNLQHGLANYVVRGWVVTRRGAIAWRLGALRSGIVAGEPVCA